MTLGPGDRLGVYEVSNLVGAGGMGEVYKARDTRLGRTVAIKVLTADAAADSDRRRRFEQEARAIAALSHPHICTLYDIGREGSTDFLVMEYLEGQTLADRLSRGPLPVGQALSTTAEIAEALAAAHRAGILHRDLKPANVMLTKAGVKLLDFGLARLKTPRDACEVSERTTQEPATSPHTLMGTLPYMSPEQLDGKRVDARSDIFSFGALLYETVAGRRAFGGSHQASVISAIMASEPPPLSSLQPLAPPALRRLVHQCLAKDPDDRWQSVHDIARELRGMLEAGVLEKNGGGLREGRRWRFWVAAVAVAVVLIGAAAVIRELTWSSRATPEQADVALPEGASFTGGAATSLAIAPDGSNIVYSATDSDGFRLYWQGLDGSPPRAIPGTVGAVMPFFSADGTRLGFGLGAALVTLALPSGQLDTGIALKRLAELPVNAGALRGASWSEDGTILYTPGPFDGLWRVSADGSNKREVTRPDQGRDELSHLWPSFLPGGRAALFTILHTSSRQDRSAIAVLSLDTGKWKRLVEGGSYARYLPPGYLVYACNKVLLAVRFDLKTLSTIGSPVPVESDVAMVKLGGSGVASFDVSPSGSLVFIASPNATIRSSLVWVDQDGRAGAATTVRRGYVGRLDLSRDGRTLAGVTDESDHFNLFVYHLDSGRWQSVTDGADNDCPVWSPGGDRLAFASNRNGAFNIYVVRADEPRQAERLTRSPRTQCPWSWSPNGRFLAYMEHTGPGWTTWILPVEGNRQPWQWVPEGQGVSAPAFSPDGRWLAYNSIENGNWEVHVRPFPGPGERQTASGPEGGFGPFWRRDGRQILFMSRSLEDNRLLASDVAPGPLLEFARPHLAFALPFDPAWTRGASDRVGALAPDGRLVLVKPDLAAIPAAFHTVTFVRRWVDEVRAKAAAR
jgi:eukaryotic-like serine/threonine-protein kinase